MVFAYSENCHLGLYQDTDAPPKPHELGSTQGK